MSLRRMFRGPALPTVLAVVVVGASAAGAAALMNSGSAGRADKPVPPAPLHNAAWTVDAAHDAFTLTTLSGAWVTDAVVVRGGGDGLHAVKRSDGSSAWDLPVPAAGGAVCAMSPTTDGGVGVLSFQAKGAISCTSVAGIELSSGRVLWTAQTAAVFGSKDADAETVAVDGGTVLVGSPRPDAPDPKGAVSVVGLDTHTGAPKWKHTTTCDHSGSALLAGGGKVGIVEDCGGTADVLTLDSATGSATRKWTAPQLKDEAALVSLAPLAVADVQSRPTALAFAGPAAAAGSSGPTGTTTAAALTATPVTGLDSLFARLTSGGQRVPRVASGAGVVCAGAPQPVCWTAAGQALRLRGLPDPAAHLVPVAGADAARFITLPTPARPRASLCKVAPDGAVTVEADLSLPVSDFLTKAEDGRVVAYGDAADLVLIAGHPSGNTAVVDVR